MSDQDRTGQQTDMNAVMRRLRKIMALTNSSNEGEAATALHQAQALIAKYKLSTESVEWRNITESSVKTTGKDLPKWESYLAVVVSNALGVEVIVEGQRRQRYGRRHNACVIFVGIGPATEIAAYAYNVLRRQMLADLKRLFADAIAALPIHKGVRVAPTSAQREAYALGWCQAAQKKVQALMPPKDPALSDYVKHRTGSQDEARVRPARGKKSEKQSDVFGALGYKQGQNAQLHQAMAGAEQLKQLENGGSP